MCVYLIVYICVKRLINKCEVCNKVALNSQQYSATEILDPATMPSHQPKMRILFPNLLWMMEEGIADCAKKIEFIGSYGCVCHLLSWWYFDGACRRRLQSDLLAASCFVLDG